MLPDGQVVEDVMVGEEGAVRGLREGATWLQMSSVGVEWSERLAALAATHALAYVDAPVSGSTGPAKDGTLIVLASGPEGARAIAAPVFDALGKETAWLGTAGAGSRAKLVLNNWLVDLVEATAEMLHFARALGLEPGTVIDLLDDAPIGSPYAVAKGRLMLQGDFTSNFALKHALKDAKLSLYAAGAAKVELRLTESLLPAWQRALDEGDGDLDLSVIYRREGSTTSPR
jgi:3-hydroxyisobutyrate dehydrogenase